MMMKKILLSAVLLLPCIAFGQSAGSNTVNRDRPRSSYDRGAVSNGQKKRPGSVETALGKLNPENKDYGSAIDAVRIAAIEETIDNILWWTNLVLVTLFSFACLYIYWLWHEQEVRLNISADIVAQLWNSHVGSRAKAMEIIGLYNGVMRRFNEQTAAMAKKKKEEDEKQRKEAKKKRIEAQPTDKLKSGGTVNQEVEKNEQLMLLDREEELNQLEVLATTVPEQQEEFTHEVEDPQQDVEEGQDQVKRLKAEIERVLLENSRMKSQAHAQDQKISNLRTQVNKAHDQLAGMSQNGGSR